MDDIHINGISCMAYLGVTAEERESPQRILVDVTLSLDLEAAANADDLTLTVDYHETIDRLRANLENARFCLLESLARRLCSWLLEDPRVECARVLVKKFPEPLREQVNHVAVEMIRAR